MRIEINSTSANAETFSEFIKSLREANDLTAQDLAKNLLRTGGYDYRDMYDVYALMKTIYRWETRGTHPKPWALFQLSILLKVDVNYFSKFFTHPF